ncbi:MAG: hypothetical protein RLZZ502_498 [Pseudomonadota bacterium]
MHLPRHHTLVIGLLLLISSVVSRAQLASEQALPALAKSSATTNPTGPASAARIVSNDTAMAKRSAATPAVAVAASTANSAVGVAKELSLTSLPSAQLSPLVAQTNLVKNTQSQ